MATAERTARHDQTLVERAHDGLVLSELHEEGADDRGDDAGGADGERIHQHGVEVGLAGEEDRREHHGGDHGHRVGLEQVGRHAGAVADIVAHVVGDGGRIARVVLRNAGLDLADEVAAHVGALGEDAAAETGEDRDQRSAEAQGHEAVDDHAVGRRQAVDAGEIAVVERHAEKGEARHQHAGDRTGLEGHVEAAAEGLGRGLGGADVGADRHVHADEAGHARQDRADGEADGDPDAEEIGDDDEEDDTDDRDRDVLPAEIGLRAFGDRAGDFLHALRTGVPLHHIADGPEAIGDRKQPAQDN